MKALGTPTGTIGDSVVFGQNQGWSIKFLGQLRRGDSDDPSMPSIAIYHNHPLGTQGGLGLQLEANFPQNQVFDLLSLFIEVV
jgi:hypothetical protein